jgi:hypothetical protein
VVQSEVGGIFNDAFASRKPTWHSIGTQLGDPQIDAIEALGYIGADFEINKYPMMAQKPDGTVFPIPSRYSLVRSAVGDKPEEFLGVVGENYEYVQNRDVAAMINGIKEQTGWGIETVGVLDKGAVIFYTLEAGEMTIAGERQRVFYVINENRGNGRALRIMFTPVTIVCENTLQAGIDAAVVNAALFHGKGFKSELEWRATTVAQMKRAQEETAGRIDRLSKIRLENENQAKKILERVYVDPKASKKGSLRDQVNSLGIADTMSEDMLAGLDDASKRHENWKARLQEFRNAAFERYQVFNDWSEGDPKDIKARKKVAGTAYALYSAVVETEQYRKGPASDSALFGFRAQNMARAFSVLSKLEEPSRQLAAATA